MSALHEVAVPRPDVNEVEVLAKATRRRFSAEYKLKILREAETCTEPGAIGALLRREGLYSSNLTTWRAQRERGELAGLTPKKRGPAPKAKNPLAAQGGGAGTGGDPAQGPGGAGRGLGGAPKKSGGAAGDPAPAERREGLMAIITEQKATLGVAPVCQALAVPRATYYRWHQPKPVAPGDPPAGAPRLAAGGTRSRSWPSSTTSGSPTWRRPRCTPRSWTRGSTSARSARCTGCSRSTPQVQERRRQLRHPHYAGPGALGHAAQPALELGHHQAEGPGEVDLLLPLRDPGRLLPLRGRLAGGAARNRPRWPSG